MNNSTYQGYILNKAKKCLNIYLFYSQPIDILRVVHKSAVYILDMGKADAE